MRKIDLRSDTVTMPTEAMREAMACAMVGDDVYGDDPTVAELEALAAGMLGKEAGLFCASGTMGNQLAIMAHTHRGDEVIASNRAHIFIYEVGAPAVLSGVSLHLLPFPDGMFDVKMIEAAIREDDIHAPPTTLLCTENALSNGRVMDVATSRAIYELAQRRNLPVHLDGARVFNAAVSLGVEVKALTQYADTISCCLSKGLCAPVGTVLVGPSAFIARARKYRKMLGGGMRQAGILAAAGILSLTQMTQRLHVDHENARYMAKRLKEIPGVTLDERTVEINIVFFRLDRPEALLRSIAPRMREQGIFINGAADGVMRFVTSNDVSKADIDVVIEALKAVAGV